jgi:alanine transaminase
MVTDTFKSMDRITCNEVQGAMYAFPQIQMPEAAIAEAKVNMLAFPQIHMPEAAIAEA